MTDVEEVLRVQHIRWFNLSFKPAVEKLHASGKISKYIADKLLEPAMHLERKRIPKALIAQPSNTPGALEVPDDEHLLLPGHERVLQQQEERQDDSALPGRIEAQTVPATVHEHVGSQEPSSPPSAKLCKHIWRCSCSNGP